MQIDKNQLSFYSIECIHTFLPTMNDNAFLTVFYCAQISIINNKIHYEKRAHANGHFRINL